MAKFCTYCGSELKGAKKFCSACGSQVLDSNNDLNTETQKPTNASSNYPKKSRVTAGVLGIFFGWLGVHNFYLGYTGKAIGQLLLSLSTCCILGIFSEIWGFIEATMILTGTIDKDGKGNELID